jgi:hypothetical protein
LRKLLYNILGLTILSSCSLFERTDDILLARLGDSYLYESDVKSILNTNISSADSLAFIQQYIQNWAQEELLLQKAKLNINLSELDIDQRLEDYRRSLLIHAYEQKLIQQNHDTVVSSISLQNYYQEHSDDYILAQDIVKLMLVKVSVIAPEIDSIKKWVFAKDSLNLYAIEAYAHQYAKRFYYNPNEWLNWSEFERFMPNTIKNEAFFEHSNTLYLQDSLDVYFVRLFDSKAQGEIAPLEHVEEEIKSILLNQKKLKTVDLIQSKLLEDAKKSKQFEIY